MYQNKEICANEKFETLRYMSFLYDELTPTEFVVFHFIWMRTVWWGKHREKIKFSHFINGIEDTISGLQIKERQLQNVLKSLEKKGVISKIKTTSVSYFYINYKWSRPPRWMVETTIEQ